MPSIAELLNNTTESIMQGEVLELTNSLYKIQVGSTEVYASSAIPDQLYVGQLVVIGKSTGMYFIIGVGRATSKEPTIIRIRG